MKILLLALTFISLNLFSYPVSNLSDICKPLGPYSESGGEIVFSEKEVIKVMECAGYLRGITETLSVRHQIYSYIEEVEETDLSILRMCSKRAMIELDSVNLYELGENVYEKIQTDVNDGKDVLDQNSTVYLMLILQNLCKVL